MLVLFTTIYYTLPYFCSYKLQPVNPFIMTHGKSAPKEVNCRDNVTAAGRTRLPRLVLVLLSSYMQPTGWPAARTNTRSASKKQDPLLRTLYPLIHAVCENNHLKVITVTTQILSMKKFAHIQITGYQVCPCCQPAGVETNVNSGLPTPKSLP